MNQKGQEDVRKRAASSLIGKQVLGDGEEGRVLQGRVEKYRDVSTDLFSHVQVAMTRRTKKEDAIRPGKVVQPVFFSMKGSAPLNTRGKANNRYNCFFWSWVVRGQLLVSVFSTLIVQRFRGLGSFSII